jgi:HK97 family phage major capsid protein
MGAAVHANHIPGILPLPQRRMTVRALLMPGQTDSPIIDYDKEIGFNNNADVVAEGDLKPQSDFEIEEVQIRTKVLAHWFRVSKQTLSDVSQIRSIIDNRLLYGLAFKEELQLLFGGGRGENLHGIVPQASAYAAPTGFSGGTSIDQIRYMALQAVLAEYPATGIIMNPTDWAWIETLKDTEGRYIIGNPQGSIAPTLWGLPIVQTPAMQADKVLVGAFDMGAQVFDQWQSRIETGFQNDDFVKNKVTILAEERLALAVYRPEAFIFGDFGRVA